MRLIRGLNRRYKEEAGLPIFDVALYLLIRTHGGPEDRRPSSVVCVRTRGYVNMKEVTLVTRLETRMILGSVLRSCVWNGTGVPLCCAAALLQLEASCPACTVLERGFQQDVMSFQSVFKNRTDVDHRDPFFQTVDAHYVASQRPAFSTRREHRHKTHHQL